ncbi:MAG: serine hydrolase domain-containing protein [Actinomycetes bacterium]
MDDAVDAAIEAAAGWCEQWRERQRIPGAAFVVTDPEATRFVGLSGVADLAGSRALSADQRWQIGSISKAFTAITVLQLAAAGRVQLSDPVTQHLPWAHRLRPDVTVHHLLSHTAGLPAGNLGLTDSMLETATLGALGRPQPPGHGFHYSNSGYEALGDIVEHLTAGPFEDYLESAVLGPLGMAHSQGAVRPDRRGTDVLGHRPPRDDVRWTCSADQQPDLWFPTSTADGSIVSTPDDMARYLRFLLRGCAPGIVTADQFEQLSAQHVQTDDTTWYGYGLETIEDQGGPTLGHSGGMVGLYADVRVDRERGLGTCLMVNGHGNVTAANRYLLDLLRTAAGAVMEPTEPDAWPAPPVDDPAPDSLPQAWTAMVGLYRSYNPWAPTLQVAGHAGGLLLVDPVDGTGERLVPVDDTRFAPGHAGSPELVSFDVLVDGRYLTLDVSGATYARVRRPIG